MLLFGRLLFLLKIIFSDLILLFKIRAIAIQTILIFAPGIFNKARQHASSVAPVVITSSMSIKCLL